MNKPRYIGFNKKTDPKAMWQRNEIPLVGLLLFRYESKSAVFQAIYARWVRRKRIVFPDEAEKFVALFKEKHPEMSNARFFLNWYGTSVGSWFAIMGGHGRVLNLFGRGGLFAGESKSKLSDAQIISRAIVALEQKRGPFDGVQFTVSINARGAIL